MRISALLASGRRDAVIDRDQPTSLVEAILRDRRLVIAEQHLEVKRIPFTTVRTWERGLVQVLTNLIDNAIKYSRKANPPRLRIAAIHGWFGG